MPLLYVRFRAAAEPALKGLFKDLEPRSKQPEYGRLMADCTTLYCQTRASLVSPFVKQKLEANAKQPLPIMVRCCLKSKERR